MPRGLTAATGIDAMVHAIEAYTSKVKKNPMSDQLARQALVSAHVDGRGQIGVITGDTHVAWEHESPGRVGKDLKL